MKPVLPDVSSVTLQSAHYTLASPTAAAPLTGADELFDSIGLSVTASGFTMPSGNPGAVWLGCLNYYGSATAAAMQCSLAGSGSGDVGYLPLFVTNDGNDDAVPSVTFTGQQLCKQFCFVESSGSGGSVDFATSGNVLPGGSVVGELFVTRLNAGIVVESSTADTTKLIMSPYEVRLGNS